MVRLIPSLEHSIDDRGGETSQPEQAVDELLGAVEKHLPRLNFPARVYDRQIAAAGLALSCCGGGVLRCPVAGHQLPQFGHPFRMAKYDALFEYLCRAGDGPVEMTFEEISQLVGACLRRPSAGRPGGKTRRAVDGTSRPGHGWKRAVR